jgi:hypothetical protein
LHAERKSAVTNPSTPLPAGTIGYIDVPNAEAIVGPRATMSGWALDPAGIRAVEVRLDGRSFAARTRVRRADVAQAKPGYPDGEHGGFEFSGDFTSCPPPSGIDRRKLEVVAIATDGRETIIGRRSLIEPAALSRWRHVANASGAAFYILPALSGAFRPGVFGLDEWYAPYLSRTTRIGMRVPILYLRTTRGAREDFAFDPDFDLSRKCGELTIADDNLAGLLAVSVEKKLPVLVTLNGGIWGDASCSAPEWDVTDALEEDPANCQWNEKNEVMPDDFLRHLPGSLGAPELGRSLTFNVYASRVRQYKKRNLQQAAKHIVEFMRAHPDLLVGVNVDPDTYLNPFFEEKQWYDYNPGTLKQFRHWLAGTGPYAGESGVPDLRAYRRRAPLDLREVRRLSGEHFARWEEVDPPRIFSRDPSHPFWTDPWVREWEIFRRHLVGLHYDDLSRWLVEAGIPPDGIWSSQGFMAPAHDALPFAIAIDSPVKNYDSGGVSVEGSKPAEGHLGAILYGASASNRIAMENGGSLFATFASVDPGFAVVELNTADLRRPSWLPGYADGYEALRDLWNAGAKFVSPMAWNGWSGDYAGQPGYVAHTSWRNTPLEDAACDFLLARAGLPLGALLWTFGSARHADDDGWSASRGAISARNGSLALEPDASGRVVLLSPPELPLRARAARTFVLGLAPANSVRQVDIFARGERDGEWWRIAIATGAEWKDTAAGIALDADASSRGKAAYQWRIEIAFATTMPRDLTRVAALLE